MAERYRIFPLKIENGILHLAIDRIDLGLLKSSLSDLFKIDVKFSLTTSYDINYAIEKAYSEEFQRVVVGRRLGELLVRDNIISGEQLAVALRRQKRTGESLGAVLVAEGLVEESFLERYLREQKEAEIKDRRDREEQARQMMEKATMKPEKREEEPEEPEGLEEPGEPKGRENSKGLEKSGEENEENEEE